MATGELNSLRDVLGALGAGEITTEEAAAFARAGRVTGGILLYGFFLLLHFVLRTSKATA